MPFDSSWVPNEDPHTLLSERSWLQGVVVSAVAYGVTVSLYLLTFYHLVREKNRVELKERLPLFIYITITFILGTLYMCALAAFTQMAFIDNRNYPGGPNAFENNMFSIPVDESANAAFFLSNWMCDALLVWRFKVIYQMCQGPLWLVMLFPCLILAGSMGLGIMLLIQVSTTNPFVAKGINYTLPYFGLSLALNILLTAAIVLRLLTLKCHAAAVLGPRHGSYYTSIAAMVVESAALYSAVSITFIVLFGTGNAVSQVFIQSLNQFQIISTFLIVFRVAQGKGWNEGTAAHVVTGRRSGASELSKIRFASPTPSSPGEVTKHTMNVGDA